MMAAAKPVNDGEAIDLLAVFHQANSADQAKLGQQFLDSIHLNDVRVMGGDPSDRAMEFIAQAHAVSIVTGIAIEQSTEAGTEEMLVRPQHVLAALNALSTLLALAHSAVSA